MKESSNKVKSNNQNFQFSSLNMFNSFDLHNNCSLNKRKVSMDLKILVETVTGLASKVYDILSEAGSYIFDCNGLISDLGIDIENYKLKISYVKSRVYRVSEDGKNWKLFKVESSEFDGKNFKPIFYSLTKFMDVKLAHHLLSYLLSTLPKAEGDMEITYSNLKIDVRSFKPNRFNINGKFHIPMQVTSKYFSKGLYYISLLRFELIIEPEFIETVSGAGTPDDFDELEA